MINYELCLRSCTVAETTDEQIRALAASFYPTIRAYYDTEEGKKMFEEFMDAQNVGDNKPAA